MAMAAGPADSAPAAAYGRHWEQLHHASGKREWHTTWTDIRTIALPYLLRAASRQPSFPAQHTFTKQEWASVIDVGCGSSQMGHQLLQEPCLAFKQLLLVDAATGLLEHLMDGQLHTSSPCTQTPACIAYLAADCRRLPLHDNCCQAIIDKGTLDALWSDTDKLAMLRECARVLSRDGGAMLSISFSSPARLKLLQQHCPALGLQYHVHVIGKGDPARGHEVRFLTVLSHSFGDVPYQPDELTQLVLTRLEKTGSLLDTEHDADGGPGSICAPLCSLFE